MSIGIQLKRIRNVRKMNQDDLATRLGISVPYISQIENGKRVPSIEVIYGLAKELNVSAAYFFQESGFGVIEGKKIDDSFLTPHILALIEAYNRLDESKQELICKALGISHPASERITGIRQTAE